MRVERDKYKKSSQKKLRKSGWKGYKPDKRREGE